MKRIVPRQNYVLMAVEESKSKLALPDGVVLEKPYVVIVAKGEKVKTLKVGDKVIFVPGAFFNVSLTDTEKGAEVTKKYMMTREEDIIAIVEDKK